MADKVLTDLQPTYFCPLFNFEFVVEPKDPKQTIIIPPEKNFNSFERVEFMGNTTLKSIDREELKELEPFATSLIEEHIPQRFLPSYNDLPAIELYEKTDEKLITVTENILLSLRLYKEGDVFTKIIWHKSHCYQITLTPSYEMPPSSFSELYSLDKQEIGRVKEIFEKLSSTNIEERRQIRIACDRLNRSYGKSMMDEKIIDFMIALEALFVRQKANNSGVIMATGCSNLLGKNEKEREQIYDFINDCYDFRNKIVHGSQINLKGIREKVDKLQSYLRESIVALL